jgi:ribonuclease-3
MDDQQWLQRNFGCRLSDAGLLSLALSHRSVGSRNNERLEFLGDAVLGYVVSEALYRRFPDADEGQLSRLRVALVKGSALAELAREIGLGAQLNLGAGERSGGGRQRKSILADTLEALLGAVTLDLGLEACREVILHLFSARIEGLDPERAHKDPKTSLQEYLQGSGRELPRYEVVSSAGEDHQRVFRVRCFLDDSPLACEAEGRSRRAAEQAAAGQLLAQLQGGGQ